jgi:hypothetical protein
VALGRPLDRLGHHDRLLTVAYDFVADTGNSPFSFPIAAVPEPGTIGMMLAGLACVSLLARRRQRKS